LIHSPADRVPVEGEGLGSDKGADGDDQGDVEHRWPHHAAHSNVVLTNIMKDWINEGVIAKVVSNIDSVRQLRGGWGAGDALSPSSPYLSLNLS
jgi:hypothetical protein